VGELIEAKTEMRSELVQAVSTDDIAMLHTNFEGTSKGEDGQPVQIGQRAIEILRRQADGTWKLIIGDPTARER